MMANFNAPYRPNNPVGESLFLSYSPPKQTNSETSSLTSGTEETCSSLSDQDLGSVVDAKIEDNRDVSVSPSPEEYHTIVLSPLIRSKSMVAVIPPVLKPILRVPPSVQIPQTTVVNLSPIRHPDKSTKTILGRRIATLPIVRRGSKQGDDVSSMPSFRNKETISPTLNKNLPKPLSLKASTTSKYTPLGFGPFRPVHGPGFCQPTFMFKSPDGDDDKIKPAPIIFGGGDCYNIDGKMDDRSLVSNFTNAPTLCNNPSNKSNQYRASTPVPPTAALPTPVKVDLATAPTPARLYAQSLLIHQSQQEQQTGVTAEQQGGATAIPQAWLDLYHSRPSITGDRSSTFTWMRQVLAMRKTSDVDSDQESDVVSILSPGVSNFLP